jgi:KAP family P-loop domain/Putative peptidoglycan binding domain
MAAPVSADFNTIRRLQQRLTSSGYGSLPLDGVYGPATRDAVQQLLREIGWHQPDGELTEEVLRSLDGVLGIADETEEDLSISVRELVTAFADAPATAYELTAALLESHSQYARDAAGKFEVGQPPATALRRQANDWIHDVRSLYQPQRQGQLDGRKTIVGLALLEPALRDRLTQDGFLETLEAEIRGFPSELSGRGRALHTPDAVPTLSDQPSDVDLLGRKAFAEALGSRLADEYERSKTMRGVADSFVLHLEGPWGSGKTSLLRFLCTYLREHDWLVVQFNAWQHQRVGAPWWLLIAEVQREAVRTAGQPKKLSLRIRALAWRMWIARWRLAGVLAAAGLLGVAIVWAVLAGAGADAALIGVIAGAVSTLAAAIAALRGMGGAFSSRRGADDFVRQAADPMNTLRRRFYSMVDSIERPVAVVVDDLDRCRPAYVVELIEGIQTVLRDPPVTFVVAADRHWLYDSYAAIYPEHGKDGGDPGRPLGHLFLEKAFQLSTSVPRLSQSEREDFWRSLIFQQQQRDDSELEDRLERQFGSARTEQAVFAALDRLSTGSPAQRRAARALAVRRLASPELERATQHTLIRFAPLLEPNPRAMKRLVNAYGVERALQIIGGHSTELDYPRERLALWTILKSRWPLLADYLVDEPAAVQHLKTATVPDDVAQDASRPYLAKLFTEPDVRRIVSGEVVGVDLDEPSLRLLIEGPAAPTVMHS